MMFRVRAGPAGQFKYLVIIIHDAMIPVRFICEAVSESVLHSFCGPGEPYSTKYSCEAAILNLYWSKIVSG